MYDVKVEFFDQTKFRRSFVRDTSKYLWDYIKEFSEFINVGNLGSGQHYELEKIHTPGDLVEQTYEIFIEARNGIFFQLAHFRRSDNGNWLVASRVYKDKELLFEHISDKYPRNDRGEIDWY